MKRMQHRRLDYRKVGYWKVMGIAWMIAVADLLAPAPAAPNPYLAKPGEAPAPAPAVAPAAAAVPDYAAELQQLAQLKQQGILTEEEFEAKKKQILGI